MMKSKIFTSTCESSLEAKINDFFEAENVEVFKVKFQACAPYGYAVLILYKEK